MGTLTHQNLRRLAGNTGRLRWLQIGLITGTNSQLAFPRSQQYETDRKLYLEIIAKHPKSEML